MADLYKDRLNGRSLVFAFNQGQEARYNRDTFKDGVAFAAEHGATHIHVGLIPFRTGSWVFPDGDDPYAAWCVHSAGILRVCPPPEIQEWVSRQHAEDIHEIIQSQLDVMKPYGLKGVMYAIEPMWLPEGVYAAHPRWRGAQCELGRIAKAPYFTPSIDEPEVLDLYRRAMKEFATLFPDIDQYRFMTNDSGGGLPWTPNIYPGPNGPVEHRRKDGGKRLADWMQALKDGAAEGGTDMRFNLHSSGLTPELVASTREKTHKDTFVNGVNGDGKNWSFGGASLPAGIWSYAYPAVGLSDPEAFIGGLQGIYAEGEDDGSRAEIGYYDHDADLVKVLFDAFEASPGTGIANRTEIALRASEMITGSADSAEQLYGAWQQVKQATHCIAQLRQKGFNSLLPFACVSARWLIRPLVPEPMKLRDDEKDYYEKFIFSVHGWEHDSNFGMILGKSVFNGESVMWMSRWCIEEAMATLEGARNTVKSIIGSMGKKGDKAFLERYEKRIGAFKCLANNARNTIMYQYALDVIDQPMLAPNIMDYDDNMINDYRSLRLRKIAREELDNIAALIEILESTDERILDFAEHDDEENVFMLSTHLIDDLKKKMSIMMAHWQDYEYLYPTCRVYEFEPPCDANIVEENVPADDLADGRPSY